MPAKRVKDVIGTKEFRKFFNQVPENEPRKKELCDAFKTLQEDCVGTKSLTTYGLNHT
jgi:hypothetical protein